MRCAIHPRLFAAAVSALALHAPNAMAQAGGDSVVIRAVTPYERQVEELARGVINGRRRAIVLFTTREQIRGSLRSPSLQGDVRTVLVSRLRSVESQLASAENTWADLRKQLDELCAPSREAVGWLGIVYQSGFSVDLRPDGVQLTRFQGYPALESVEPGSPADKAGLRRGDVLLSLDGQDLQDATITFRALLKPGARLAVRLRRGLELKQVPVVIEPRPADFRPTCTWEDDLIATALAPLPEAIRVRGVSSAANGYRFETGGERGNRFEILTPNDSVTGSIFLVRENSQNKWAIGAQLVPLNPGLTRLTGVDQGAFVAEIAVRSPAALAGLREGDVVISADGRPVQNPDGLRAAIENSATKSLRLQVVRQRKTETLNVRW